MMKYGWLMIAVMLGACSDDKGTQTNNTSNNTACQDCDDAGADTSTATNNGGSCLTDGCENGRLCNENTGACVDCQFDEECGANGVCNDTGGCECASGFHDCSGQCVSNSDVATCGESCVPCQAPAGGDATCDGTACGFTCQAPLNATTDSCVECLSNSTCTDVTKSLCANGSCSACTGNADCSHLAGTTVCASGTCVECASEADCGGNVCDVSTGTCTDTAAGSVDVCGKCTVSAQCGAGLACVPMEFAGNAHNSYCLAIKGGEDCPSPYVFEINRADIDGTSSTYCGINETVTTCEGILDFGEACPSGQNSECGDPTLDDARCEPVGFDFDLLCTFSCTSSTQCLPTDEFGCISADYCGGV